MYKPSLAFDRTPEEKRDPFVSWLRDDQAFFAAGACHILADIFCQLHRSENFHMVHIKPAEGFAGVHVYASNGKWAFDHNGWTLEKELLEVTEKAYKERYPGWEYEKIEIQYTLRALDEITADGKMRMPYHYPFLPWERAHKYIQQFPSSPPK